MKLTYVTSLWSEWHLPSARAKPVCVHTPFDWNRRAIAEVDAIINLIENSYRFLHLIQSVHIISCKMHCGDSFRSSILVGLRRTWVVCQHLGDN